MIVIKFILSKKNNVIIFYIIKINKMPSINYNFYTLIKIIKLMFYTFYIYIKQIKK